MSEFFNRTLLLFNKSTLPFNQTTLLPSNGGDDNFKLMLSVLIGIIYSITFFVGLIGNLLVVLTIILHKRMRNSTNILILNLAVADLIFIIFCVPFTGLNYLLDIWYFGDFWCKIVHYTSNVTATASILLLVLMSLDRYLAIAKPYSSISYRNQRNTIIVVLLIWSLILSANLYHAFLWTNHRYVHVKTNTSRSVCILKYYVTKNLSGVKSEIEDVELKLKFYYLAFFLFAYLLPLISIFILYGLIIYKLSENKGQQVSKSKRRVTCMVIAVVSCFIVCWTPLQIMLVIQHVFAKKFEKHEIVILIISNGLSYINSCLNPIIYGFSNNEFKKAYSNIIGCKFENGYKGDYMGAKTTAPTAKKDGNATANLTAEQLALTQNGQKFEFESQLC